MSDFDDLASKLRGIILSPETEAPGVSQQTRIDGYRARLQSVRDEVDGLKTAAEDPRVGQVDREYHLAFFVWVESRLEEVEKTLDEMESENHGSG